MTHQCQSDVYSAFAEIYDQVMRDVDYDSWTQYVIDLTQKYEVEVNTVLDLACGTGGHALRFAQLGYQVMGIDRSYPMLELAREKAELQHLDVQFFQSPMESFSKLKLGREFDLVICLYDSLNYIVEDDLVARCFEDAFSHVRPGGLFIFDVTTEYNLIKNFSGFTFSENFDDASYIWENQYSIESKKCVSKVTIFQHINGHYQKFVEEHIQKVYPRPWLIDRLRDIGFEVLAVLRNMSEMPATPKCERIHFVCRKQ